MDSNKRKIFRVADDGFGWIEEESEYVNENMGIRVEKPYTLIQPPNPNWKPFFDWKQQKWIETATEEEMQVGEDLIDPYDVIEKQNKLIEELLKEVK